MLELDAKRVKQPQASSPKSAYAAVPTGLVTAGATRDSAAPDGQGPLAALGGWAVGTALRGLYSQSEALGLSSGDEFAVALWLCKQTLAGAPVPDKLPPACVPPSKR